MAVAVISEEHQEMHSMKIDVDEDERGTLFCCGRRLDWDVVGGTSVLEVRCPKCGAVYAMDAGEDLEEPKQVGLERAVVDSLLLEVRSGGEEIKRRPPRLGFAG